MMRGDVSLLLRFSCDVVVGCLPPCLAWRNKTKQGGGVGMVRGQACSVPDLDFDGIEKDLSELTMSFYLLSRPLENQKTKNKTTSHAIFVRYYPPIIMNYCQEASDLVPSEYKRSVTRSSSLSLELLSQLHAPKTPTDRTQCRRDTPY